MLGHWEKVIIVARQWIRIFAATILWLSTISPVFAVEKPTGTILLTLTGPALEKTNIGNITQFDEAMLLALPQITVKTKTPWNDGLQEYTGPDFSELIRAFAPKSNSVQVTALNDYSISIRTDFIDYYRPVIAIRHNGQPMRIREKGPLFIVFPYDEHEALRNETVYAWSVWQISAMHFE